jgi:hypothetical protein
LRSKDDSVKEASSLSAEGIGSLGRLTDVLRLKRLNSMETADGLLWGAFADSAGSCCDQFHRTWRRASLMQLLREGTYRTDLLCGRVENILADCSSHCGCNFVAVPVDEENKRVSPKSRTREQSGSKSRGSSVDFSSHQQKNDVFSKQARGVLEKGRC